MSKNTSRTARNISSSGQTAPRGTRHFANTSVPKVYPDKLTFPDSVLAPLPPTGVPDDLLLAAVKDVDIDLTVPVPQNIDPDNDTLQLILDDQPIGTPKPVDGAQPGDSFTLTLTAAQRKAAGDGQHTLNYEAFFFFGNEGERGPGQSFVIDTMAPGSPFLGILSIDDNIVKNGISVDVLKDDGQGNLYLESYVPSYEGVQPGDLIYPVINGVEHKEATPVEEKDIGVDIMLPFSQELLTSVSDGPVDLGYVVIDRAGNQSAHSRQLTLFKLIKDKIDDLEEPDVPLAADGLLNYADAIAPAYATIPGHSGIKRADSIALKVGDTELTPVSVSEDGEDGSPLMDITIPADVLYAEWAKRSGITDQIADLNVSYRVLRGTLTAGTSPEATVPTNLYVPGGEPGPDPVHDQLRPLTVRSYTGAIDRIPVDDSNMDAQVTVLWRNSATPSMPVFEENDVLSVTFGSETLDDYIVTAADVIQAGDLTVRLPAATIKSVGSGNIVSFYTVTRAVQGGSKNTVRSPDKSVEVVSSSDLPGGDSGLVGGDFAPLNIRNAIGPEQIRQGVTFTVPAYVNQKVGDRIRLNFARFPGSSHKQGETPMPGSEWTDEVIAKSGTENHEFRIPQTYLITPELLSHTDTTYTVTNNVGSVTSAIKLVVIDPRGFSGFEEE